MPYFFLNPAGQTGETDVIFFVTTPLMQVIVVFFATLRVGFGVGVGVGFGAPVTIGLLTDDELML